MFFFFKQKTAYEMRISDWSSDVCSSDLREMRGEADKACRYDHACRGERQSRTGNQLYRGEMRPQAAIEQNDAQGCRADDIGEFVIVENNAARTALARQQPAPEEAKQYGNPDTA